MGKLAPTVKALTAVISDDVTYRIEKKLGPALVLRSPFLTQRIVRSFSM